MKKYFFTIITLLFLYPLAIKAAEIYFLPNSLEVYDNNDFITQVKISSEEEVNAIDAQVLWNPEMLTLKGINDGGSVFDLWVKKPSLDQSGSLRLVAGATQPFSGSDGKVVDLIWQAKSVISKGNFSFAVDSKLIKADGLGQAADLRLFDSDYEILSRPDVLPVLTSQGMPDENHWYASKIFDVHWQASEGWSYSYLLTPDITQVPDKEPEKILFNVNYEGLEDGVYYFKLLGRDTGNRWYGPVVRRVMIDTAKPESLDIAVAGRDVGFGVGNSLVFYGTDLMSGVDYYQYKEDGQDWQTISSPYNYKVNFLRRSVVIRAYDKAGNYLERTVVVPGWLNQWWWVLVIGSLVILALYLIYRYYFGKK